jgi:hypothetical protein
MATSNALVTIAITALNFLRMALAKQSLAHIAEWKRLCSNLARRESQWDSNPVAKIGEVLGNLESWG